MPRVKAAHADSAARDHFELFTDLVVSAPSRRRRRSFAGPISLVLHAALLALLILVPIARITAPPVERDYIRALLYDPPPPPPPPLPKGPGLTQRMPRAATPDEARPKPSFVAPVPAPPAEEPLPTPADAGATTGGSPTGSDLGVPEGMEEGVEGGVVGGVPGGVLGGVVGGTGDIPVPVMNYDRPPRLLRLIKPEYPHDAFVKKIEGVVMVEILIDANGRVVRTRVLRSIPLLDRAAVAAVRQWLFAPAIQDGRAVATVAMAPVTFHLY